MLGVRHIPRAPGPTAGTLPGGFGENPTILKTGRAVLPDLIWVVRE